MSILDWTWPGVPIAQEGRTRPEYGVRLVVNEGDGFTPSSFAQYLVCLTGENFISGTVGADGIVDLRLPIATYTFKAVDSGHTSSKSAVFAVTQAGGLVLLVLSNPYSALMCP